MLATVYFLASIYFGHCFVRYFRVSQGDLLYTACISVLSGACLSTWLGFILILALGNPANGITAATIILLVFGAALLARNTEPRKGVPPDRFILSAYLVLAIFILPFFLFGVRITETGDLRFNGYFVDFSYHLAVARSFVEWGTFPLRDLQLRGVDHHYYALVDLQSAFLMLGGWNEFAALVIPNLVYGIALIVVPVWFFHSLLGDSRKAFYAVILSLLGHQAISVLLFSAFSIHDHLPVGFEPGTFRWWRESALTPFLYFLNPIQNIFLPQRPMLIGFPFALSIANVALDAYRSQKQSTRVICGALALWALLPAVQLHCFVLISPFALYLLCKLERSLRAFSACLIFLGVALVQVLYLISAAGIWNIEFFDVINMFRASGRYHVYPNLILSIVHVWLRAVGLPLVLGCSTALVVMLRWKKFAPSTRIQLLPLVVLFSLWGVSFPVMNITRITPFWEDWNKFFLFWNLTLSGFTALLLARLPAFIVYLVLSVGALIPSAFVNYGEFVFRDQRLFSPCDRITGEWIRANTPKTALFLTSDDVIHYLTAIGGRAAVDGGYTATSYGVSDASKQEVWEFFRGVRPAVALERGATHIVVGPSEYSHYDADVSELKTYGRTVFEMTCNNFLYAVIEIEPRKVRNHPAPDPNRVYLSRVKPFGFRQDWGSLRFDRNVIEKQICVGGSCYEHGIGTHATSEIAYRIDGTYSELQAIIGIDDSQARGSAVFRVIGDGRELFRSPVLVRGGSALKIRVPIHGVTSLLLAVDDGGDGKMDDNAVWADAVLVKTPM